MCCDSALEFIGCNSDLHTLFVWLHSFFNPASEMEQTCDSWQRCHVTRKIQRQRGTGAHGKLGKADRERLL